MKQKKLGKKVRFPAAEPAFQEQAALQQPNQQVLAAAGDISGMEQPSAGSLAQPADEQAASSLASADPAVAADVQSAAGDTGQSAGVQVDTLPDAGTADGDGAVGGSLSDAAAQGIAAEGGDGAVAAEAIPSGGEDQSALDAQQVTSAGSTRMIQLSTFTQP